MRGAGPAAPGGLALLLLLLAAGRLAAAGQPRPSVVLVACDSFDGRLTFYPGNQTVALPFINFMKRYGTVFLNAYTNSPICCPSRAAMWSGLFTHLTESWNNFKGLDLDYVTWMDLMQKHGYHTQKYGKLDYTSGHHSVSNRVEAWTRDVDFLLRQEGRPTVKLTEMHPVDYYSSYTKNCTGEFTKQEVRNIRAFYYAMCAEADAMLGEIISALRDTGLLKRTIIIFTADHGELAMEHRQFYKMSMYEGSSHVPLLVMGPGIKQQQQISNLVSLVDIYPTMLDIARIPAPQNLSGYSLMPLLLEMAEDEVSSRRPRPLWVLSEFHGCNVNSSTYMLRTDKWKYITYSDGHSVLPQLFDLSADPDELKNVAMKFPVVAHSLDKILHSIVNYPKVSSSVQEYNKRQFISWKQSLGQNYSNVIANLRWHQDWLKEPKKYEDAIDKWLSQRQH
ncbi:arylsulfatase K isoform X3 [Apteryx mantelli]|uniref:Arylsulfatase K isoform X3 n=1 Tax=Apteryx mantelli TaxID=2696672 RepID=A0ABM4G2T3_9AVES